MSARAIAAFVHVDNVDAARQAFANIASIGANGFQSYLGPDSMIVTHRGMNGMIDESEIDAFNAAAGDNVTWCFTDEAPAGPEYSYYDSYWDLVSAYNLVASIPPEYQ